MNDFYDDDLEGLNCAACGGQLCYLGHLGSRVHFRCADCGMDSSMEEEPEVDGDDDIFLEG